MPPNKKKKKKVKQKHGEAITHLLQVPKACKDCFEKAQKAVEPIYKATIDRTCTEKLAKMKAELGKYADSKALDIYTQIPPEATC